MSAALYTATLVTALGCGLIAGAFFAFSSFVMGALGRLPAAQGIAAMQSINILAVTPVFMTALFGTAAAFLVGDRRVRPASSVPIRRMGAREAPVLHTASREEGATREERDPPPVTVSAS